MRYDIVNVITYTCALKCPRLKNPNDYFYLICKVGFGVFSVLASIFFFAVRMIQEIHIGLNEEDDH